MERMPQLTAINIMQEVKLVNDFLKPDRQRSFKATIDFNTVILGDETIKPSSAQVIVLAALRDLYPTFQIKDSILQRIGQGDIYCSPLVDAFS